MKKGIPVNEWLLGALGALAVLACPAMMLAAFLGPKLPWQRLTAKVRRTSGETQA